VSEDKAVNTLETHIGCQKTHMRYAKTHMHEVSEDIAVLPRVFSVCECVGCQMRHMYRVSDEAGLIHACDMAHSLV